MNGHDPLHRRLFSPEIAVDITHGFLSALAAVTDQAAVARLLETVCRELGFSHYALITHEDRRTSRAGQVDIRIYPDAIAQATRDVLINYGIGNTLIVMSAPLALTVAIIEPRSCAHSHRRSDVPAPSYQMWG